MQVPSETQVTLPSDAHFPATEPHTHSLSIMKPAPPKKPSEVRLKQFMERKAAPSVLAQDKRSLRPERNQDMSRGPRPWSPQSSSTSRSRTSTLERRPALSRSSSRAVPSGKRFNLPGPRSPPLQNGGHTGSWWVRSAKETCPAPGPGGCRPLRGHLPSPQWPLDWPHSRGFMARGPGGPLRGLQVKRWEWGQRPPGFVVQGLC